MVISFSNRFAFLRVPKNASTSLATYFVHNLCDENDIYTGIGDSGVVKSGIPIDVMEKYKMHWRFIHLTLQEIIDENTIDEIDLKEGIDDVIAVLRNPLERQLSLYFYKHRNNKNNISVEGFRKDFAGGCHIDDLNNKILQTDYPVYNGVDYGTYWKYEDLSEKLADFAESKGKEVTDLRNYKSNIGTNTPKSLLVDEFYDDATKKAVLKYYEKDYDKYMSL